MPHSLDNLSSFNCMWGLHPLFDLANFSCRYVNRDREITKRYVQHAEKRGVKALFITVDAPQLGRREKDMRMKFVDDGAGAKVQEGQSDVKKDQGVARAISVRNPSQSSVAIRSLSDHDCSLSSTPASHGRTSRGSGVSPTVRPDLRRPSPRSSYFCCFQCLLFLRVFLPPRMPSWHLKPVSRESS